MPVMLIRLVLLVNEAQDVLALAKHRNVWQPARTAQ